MIKQILLNPITAILITFLVIVSIMSMRESVKPITEAEVDIAQLEREKTEANQELQSAEVEIEAKSLPFYQEKKLRDELLLQKEGEYTIVLPPIPIPSPTVTPAPSTPSPWQDWQAIIF